MFTTVLAFASATLIFLSGGGLARRNAAREDDQDMNCVWLTDCGPVGGPVQKSVLIFCESGFGSCDPQLKDNQCTMATTGLEGYPQKACAFEASSRVFNFIIAEDAQTLPVNNTVGTGWDWRQFYMIQKDTPNHVLYMEPSGNVCVNKYFATTSAIYNPNPPFRGRNPPVRD